MATNLLTEKAVNFISSIIKGEKKTLIDSRSQMQNVVAWMVYPHVANTKHQADKGKTDKRGDYNSAVEPLEGADS